MLRRLSYCSAIVVSSLALSVSPVVAGTPELVTSCGQSVTSRDLVLANDLDCSAGDGPIFVRRRLDLAGYTIIGDNGTSFPHSDSVILCVRPAKKCTITGPGTIIGGPGAWTVYAPGHAELIDLTVQGGQLGLRAERGAILRGTDISGATEVGVLGIRGVKLFDSTINNNTRGIMSLGRVKARGSSISGNLTDGIAAQRHVTLRDTQVTGNGLDQTACDTDLSPRLAAGCVVLPFTGWHCADVASDRRVRLKGTSTCDSSLIQDGVCRDAVDYRTGLTHGVCAND